MPTPVNKVKQEPSRFQPYRNTYQKHQQQPVLRDNSKLAYSQSNLNILSFPSQGEAKRPTLESIASHAAAQGREVTTPQQLLDMCCQFPACYDPLYQVVLLKNGIIIPSLSLSCFTITIVPYDPHVSISNPQLFLVFILTSCCILS